MATESSKAAAQKLQSDRAASRELGKDEAMGTLADRLLTYVQEHGKTTVAELSEVFAVEPAQVEQLAAMLEESGLIAMRYALLHPGRTELVSLLPRQQSGKRGGAAGTLSASLPVHDYELRETLKGVDSELQEMQQQLNTIEADVMNGLVKIESSLDMIAVREKNASREDLDFLFKETARFELTRRDMSARVKVFENRLENLGNKIREVKHSVRVGPLHSIVGGVTGIFGHKKKK
ncbi:Uncharacterised protein [Candidatus Burarchaeum australiense]|nr:Uncharacterised protein [Candidatus Burarchaeum australiense]